MGKLSVELVSLHAGGSKTIFGKIPGCILTILGGGILHKLNFITKHVSLHKPNV